MYEIFSFVVPYVALRRRRGLPYRIALLDARKQYRNDLGANSLRMW